MRWRSFPRFWAPRSQKTKELWGGRYFDIYLLTEQRWDEAAVGGGAASVAVPRGAAFLRLRLMGALGSYVVAKPQRNTPYLD